MVKLPRHSKAKNTNKTSTDSKKAGGPSNSKDKDKRPLQRGKSGWKGLTLEDLKDLAQKIKDKFKWKHTPRKFQLDAIEAQLLRKDVLIHAGTGSGKTTIAAGPFAHEATEGMVSFLVSPLIALQEEQVETFEKEFGLTATAVNSTHGGCSFEVMKNICAGKWRVVMISPELITSKPFVSQVLRNAKMSRRLLSIIIDEAHVVSHWGSGFRKKYGTLGILRALVPKCTPMVAMSATLPSRVRSDVLRKLQYNLKDYTYINVGNDRTNVSLVVRAMHHPMNTFRDLTFVIPKDVKDRTDIQKTWIYVDSISTGTEIAEYLYSLLPESYRDEGVIYNYNAVFSSSNRQQLMDLFRAGIIRILICTDAAGMGCNVPDIDMVVQWKLPSSVSSFVQRAGRAARGAGRVGMAVLLVEPSVYHADLVKADNIGNDDQSKKNKAKKGIRENPNYPKSTEKGYARSHGLLRGSHDGKFDKVETLTDVPIDIDASDEGLHALVQTVTCRRQILRLIYKNEKQEISVPCCDLCCPELLDRTRPPPPVVSMRKSGLKVGLRHDPTANALLDWRKEIRSRDFEYALFPSSAILSNSTVDRLASVGPITSLIALEEVLGGSWEWFGKYGNELLDKLTSLDIPPVQTKQAAIRSSAKRLLEDGVNEEDGSVKARAKQLRTIPGATSTPAPTPVNHSAPPSRMMPMQFAHTGIPQTPRTSQHAHYQPGVPVPASTSAQHLSSNPYAGYLQLGYSYNTGYNLSSSPIPMPSSSPMYYPFPWPHNPPSTPSQPPQPPQYPSDVAKPNFGPPASS